MDNRDTMLELLRSLDRSAQALGLHYDHETVVQMFFVVGARAGASQAIIRISARRCLSR